MKLKQFLEDCNTVSDVINKISKLEQSELEKLVNEIREEKRESGKFEKEIIEAYEESSKMELGDDGFDY